MEERTRQGVDATPMTVEGNTITVSDRLDTEMVTRADARSDNRPDSVAIERGTTARVETEIVTDDSGIRIQVLAEQLVVEKEAVSRGAVHLHKGVTSDEQTLQVPVFHEEATIEHLTPEQYNASGAQDPDTMIIPIYEEQLVVERRMVLREYVRVRKQRVEEQQTVTETLRREYLEVVEPAPATPAE